MAQGQTPGDGKVSPYGNHRGATEAGPATGGHDFLTDPTCQDGGPKPRDFTQERGPERRAEVAPNTQEIPAGRGGKNLQADPSPNQRTFSGSAGMAPAKGPMKGLK